MLTGKQCERQSHSVWQDKVAQRQVICYLSFPQVKGDEPHLHWSGANVRRGWGYSNRGSVVGCQWQVKGHRRNGERSVHLYRSGSHTGKTLRVEEVAGGRWRRVERRAEKEESKLWSESGHQREGATGWINHEEGEMNSTLLLQTAASKAKMHDDWTQWNKNVPDVVLKSKEGQHLHAWWHVTDSKTVCKKKKKGGEKGKHQRLTYR